MHGPLNVKWNVCFIILISIGMTGMSYGTTRIIKAKIISAFSWDFKQHNLVVYCRRCGTM